MFMKKKLWLFFVIGALALPLTSFGLTPVAGDVVSVSNPVNDDLYAAWGNIIVQERVNGDAILAWWDINVTGPIAQDLTIAWGQVFVSSAIGDDLRILGWTVIIEESIQDDAAIFASTVVLREWVTIGWDLHVSAGTVTVNGDVVGDLSINAEQLTLGWKVDGTATIKAAHITVEESTQLNGDLVYDSSDIVPALEAATSGTVQYNPLHKNWHHLPFIVAELFVWFFFLKLIFLVLFASFIYFGLPGITGLRASNLKKSVWPSWLTGLLRFVLAPIAIIFLVGTVVGIPIALALVAAYLLVFMFMELMNVIVFTKLIMGTDITARGKKKATKPWYLHFLVIVALSLVSAIIAGLDIIAAFFAVGALIKTKWSLLKQ